ncbi:hypothetical protein [Micromonospora sp. 067-2]|uniref:hypothetical protein n=1 Tax=Micromonospora sp. 067-2 TaxID=2789270 RepID=UPI00397B1446
MSAGRPAALPAAGYALPQRLFVGEHECRVRVLPEDGGPPADIDLMALPVSRELREWLAVAVLGATGPSGPRRSVRSALDIQSILKRFTRYLATLQRPPTRPDQLRRAHLDGFILAGGKWLHRDLGSLRSTLRFAPDLPTEFWARLTQASVPKSDSTVRSYSEAEFGRITQAAREQLRAAAHRIRHARGVLELWRGGGIERSDHTRWEQGWLLDHLDRHGDVPRGADVRDRAVPTAIVVRHGGPNTVIGGLHLTYADVAAAAVLLLCLTGQNLGAVDNATTKHHRPDADAGGPATAVIELVKPRRGSRHAAMTVALQDVGAGGEQIDGLGSGRDDLVTPFGVYTLLIELARETRRWLGTDRLFAFYNAKGKTGRGFRVGVPKQSLQYWGATTGLNCDPPRAADEQDADNPAPPGPLVIDARRLRLTWLEIHQRPVAQTEHTLANEYLARNRGNIAEYQQIVASVLQQQVDGARAHRPMPVLTSEDVERAAVDPQAVATAHGLTVARLQDLIAGRLDTVMAGCTDNLDSPHTAPGRPCTASFLLCLSCPCARATPAHLPVQVLVRDALLARRQQMTPLGWGRRFGQAVTQLTDLLKPYGPTAVDDARQAATPADHDLVDRFLSTGLDHK